MKLVKSALTAAIALVSCGDEESQKDFRIQETRGYVGSMSGANRLLLARAPGFSEELVLGMGDCETPVRTIYGLSESEILVTAEFSATDTCYYAVHHHVTELADEVLQHVNGPVNVAESRGETEEVSCDGFYRETSFYEDSFTVLEGTNCVANAVVRMTYRQVVSLEDGQAVCRQHWDWHTTATVPASCEDEVNEALAED